MKALILYVETGYGFKSPSIAIAGELQKAGVEAQIVDIFDVIGAKRFDRGIKNNWRWMLRHEWLFRLTYFIGEHFFRPVFALMIPLFGPRMLAYFDQQRPDFVVATHFLPLFPVERLLQRGTAMWYRQNGTRVRVGGRKIPVFGYNSEVIASHPVYGSDLVEMFFVSTEAGRQSMIKAGSPVSKVAMTGFPIDQKYAVQFQPREQVRESLGLRDCFTILLSFGGEGIGDWSLIRALASRNMPVQVIAVCGKNDALRNEIESWYVQWKITAADSAFNLGILGFTADMQNWLYASDVSAGKAGLNVVFEALYLKRPFLVLKAMANERLCATWLESEGYGWWPRSLDDAVELIGRGIKKDTDPSWHTVETRLQTPPCGFSIEGMARTMVTMTQEFDKKRFAGVKAVCFDLAGTLCDIPIGGQWEAINAAGIISVLGRLGISGSRSDELTSQFIDEKKRLRKEAKTSLREYEIRGQLRDFLGSHGVAIDHLDAALWNELEFLFIKPELDITVRFDDAKAILEYLQHKYPLYLLSNNVSRVLVEKILANLGLSEFFDAVFVSSDIGYRKPHEKFMQAVLSGIPHAPSECVMIGDRLSQDIEMANRFGMPSIYMAMVEHEDNQGIDSIRATVTVRSLPAIRDIL
ncbi:MAG TPA: HAD-IA family hydrolase [bacterium]|nr:HAD-IA family hydrolase [bacterium]